MRMRYLVSAALFGFGVCLALLSIGDYWNLVEVVRSYLLYASLGSFVAAFVFFQVSETLEHNRNVDLLESLNTSEKNLLEIFLVQGSDTVEINLISLWIKRDWSGAFRSLQSKGIVVAYSDYHIRLKPYAFSLLGAEDTLDWKLHNRRSGILNCVASCLTNLN